MTVVRHGWARSTRFAGLGSLMVLMLLGGCTMWATYPPIEGAPAIDHPKLSPIPDLMADAIWHAYEEDGQPAPLVFNLPPGTPRVNATQKVSWRQNLMASN